MITPEQSATDQRLPLYGEVLCSTMEVNVRIQELASEVIERYQDYSTPPLFVCLLRGAAPFATRLMTEIAMQSAHFHPDLDYMKVKTYGDQLVASKPDILLGLEPERAAGRTAVILDDVLDTGVTVDATEKYLREQGATDVDVIVLAQKERERAMWQNATFHGFTFPDVWLTGMGLDDPNVGYEANRWLGLIAASIQSSAQA